MYVPSDFLTKYNRHSPLELRQAKAKWLYERWSEGLGVRKLSQLLNMSPSSIYQLTANHGYAIKHSRRITTLPWGRAVCRSAFTEEQQIQLEAAADAWGCATPTEVILELTRDWLEGDLPQLPRRKKERHDD